MSEYLKPRPFPPTRQGATTVRPPSVWEGVLTSGDDGVATLDQSSIWSAIEFCNATVSSASTNPCYTVAVTSLPSTAVVTFRVADSATYAGVSGIDFYVRIKGTLI